MHDLKFQVFFLFCFVFFFGGGGFQHPLVKSCSTAKASERFKNDNPKAPSSSSPSDSQKNDGISGLGKVNWKLEKTL